MSDPQPLFQIVVVGPRRHAVALVDELGSRGWPSQIDSDGPGNTGVDTTDPAYLAELAVAGHPTDVVAVEAVTTRGEADLPAVTAIAGRHGFWLRLHGWVWPRAAVEAVHPLVAAAATMSPADRAELARLIEGAR